MRRLMPLLLLLSACGTPGTELVPVADDFVFLEVALKG